MVKDREIPLPPWIVSPSCPPGVVFLLPTVGFFTRFGQPRREGDTYVIPVDLHLVAKGAVHAVGPGETP